MTLNEMKENLVRLGALARLAELNKERDVLHKLLGYNDKGRVVITAEQLVSKPVSKNKKWSKEQRAKFAATMRKKMKGSEND